MRQINLHQLQNIFATSSSTTLTRWNLSETECSVPKRTFCSTKLHLYMYIWFRPSSIETSFVQTKHMISNFNFYKKQTQFHLSFLLSRLLKNDVCLCRYSCTFWSVTTSLLSSQHKGQVTRPYWHMWYSWTCSYKDWCFRYKCFSWSSWHASGSVIFNAL